jgi:hypothetical protein
MKELVILLVVVKLVYLSLNLELSKLLVNDSFWSTATAVMPKKLGYDPL